MMSDQPDTQPAQQQSIPNDLDISRHEQEYTLQQQDVLPIAQFFNQVGGDLTKIDKHNVDGHRALKLDKNKVLPTSQAVQQPTHQPVHVPMQTSQLSKPQPTVVSAGAVTLKDLEHIQKIEKKLSTTNRKVATIDKRISVIESTLNVTKKRVKYNVKTDDVDCTTTSSDVLLSTICDQIASGASNITISKC